MNTLSTNQKILISSLVGFVIGAGTVLVWNVSRSVSELTTNKSTVESNSDNEVSAIAVANSQSAAVVTSVIGSENVVVENQDAGNVVYLASIVLDRDGWVAIHEDNNGALGNALGASWFPKGTSRGSVELLRDTVSGNTYHAVLYTDDGNKKFELSTDAQLVDAMNNPVMNTFVTTSAAF